VEKKLGDAENIKSIFEKLTVTYIQGVIPTDLKPHVNQCIVKAVQLDPGVGRLIHENVEKRLKATWSQELRNCMGAFIRQVMNEDMRKNMKDSFYKTIGNNGNNVTLNL